MKRCKKKTSSNPRFWLSIQPEAERQLQRFGVIDAFDPRSLLGDLQPETLGAGMVLLQPGLELLLRGEEEDRQIVRHPRSLDPG